jgi:thiol-disulfide isomerase/thioredoxin
MVSLHAVIAAITLSGVGQTVLLDFYGDRCGPCREMQPTVQAMIDAGYPVQRVNVDQKQNAALVSKYRVGAIPCFVMVANGREVDRVVGKTTVNRLVQMYKVGTKPASNSSPALLALQGPPKAAASPISFPASPSNPLAAPFEGWGNRTANNPSLAPQPNTASPVSEATLLAASVRLRIEDPDGHSCGSGTIIDCRDGAALILTCGHIFRDSYAKGKKGQIDVDLFGPNGSQRVPGELVSYSVPDVNGAEGNAKADLGLVAIRAPYALTVAHVAPPGYRVTRGMPVVSVGCNNGDSPSARSSQVTSLDKFVGAPNIQVAGQPVEGRSGGGLFSAEGYVLGVCNAADPSDREGLFAALGSIYNELDRAKLDFVYKSPSTSAPAASSMPETARPAAIAASPMAPIPQPMPNRDNAASNGVELASLNAVAGPAAGVSTLAPHEQAAMDEIRRRKKAGDEIVIIVRPRDNPDAKSEVFMIERASPEFRKQISGEARPQDRPQETSLELPRPRKILLEWSADQSTHRP